MVHRLSLRGVQNFNKILEKSEYFFDLWKVLCILIIITNHKKCTNATGNISKGVRHNKSHICKSLGIYLKPMKYVIKKYKI